MQETFTIMGMWHSMGAPAKAVVILLALMSIYSIGMSIERAWRFFKAKKESREVALRITPLLEMSRLEEAVLLTKNRDYRHSHIARVLGSGLGRFRAGGEETEDPIRATRNAIDRETLMTIADMRRGLPNLATISTTAPFIGLFGTVMGIITAFQGMAISGSGGLGAVSKGIAEALATTAFGLFVAIPAVWLYNYFLSKIERFQVEMSNASSELVDYLERRNARSAHESRAAGASS